MQAFEQRYSDMCNADFQNANQTSLSPLIMNVNSAPSNLDSAGIENQPPRCDSASIDAPMARILPYLYVGGDKDAADIGELKRNGINFILNVTNKIPCYHEGNANFNYLRIPVKDNGSENLLAYFDAAFHFIGKELYPRPPPPPLRNQSLFRTKTNGSVFVYWLTEKLVITSTVYR